MHQTTKYALNLIDPADEFSPDPLNENAQIIDAALAGNLRWKYGSYVGNGQSGEKNPRTLTFDFKPLFVAVTHETSASFRDWWVRGEKYGFANSASTYLTWTDNGVSWYSAGDGGQFNEQSKKYYYLVIGSKE